MQSLDSSPDVKVILEDNEFKAIARIAVERRRRNVLWRHHTASQFARTLSGKKYSNSDVYLCGSSNTKLPLAHSDLDLLIVHRRSSRSFLEEDCVQQIGGILVRSNVIADNFGKEISLANMCRLSGAERVFELGGLDSGRILDRALTNMPYLTLMRLYEKDYCFQFYRHYDHLKSLDFKYGVGGSISLQILKIFSKWMHINSKCSETELNFINVQIDAMVFILQVMRAYIADFFDVDICSRCALSGLGLPWFFCPDTLENISSFTQQAVYKLLNSVQPPISETALN